jgi:ABC-type uncharacterized transport system permease subunit
MYYVPTSFKSHAICGDFTIESVIISNLGGKGLRRMSLDLYNNFGSTINFMYDLGPHLASKSSFSSARK